jgi:AcrR family transcriptional regulator
MKQSKKKPRLSREDWLAKALEVLALDPAHLRVDEIARHLGVSKGSFYWHFENRADFVHALAEYWKIAYTQSVAEVVEAQEGTPEERLRFIMEQVVTRKSASYDIAVRAWARMEPGIMPVIREVDEIRLNSLRGIFEDMGFEEPELGMRTRLFVVCHSFDHALTDELSEKEALAQLESRHAFFTRR